MNLERKLIDAYYCCGELMESKGVYDMETKKYSYLSYCNNCNKIEVIKHVGKLPRKLLQSSP